MKIKTILAAMVLVGCQVESQLPLQQEQIQDSTPTPIPGEQPISSNPNFTVYKSTLADLPSVSEFNHYLSSYLGKHSFNFVSDDVWQPKHWQSFIDGFDANHSRLPSDKAFTVFGEQFTANEELTCDSGSILVSDTHSKVALFTQDCQFDGITWQLALSFKIDNGYTYQTEASSTGGYHYQSYFPNAQNQAEVFITEPNKRAFFHQVEKQDDEQESYEIITHSNSDTISFTFSNDQTPVIANNQDICSDYKVFFDGLLANQAVTFERVQPSKCLKNANFDFWQLTPFSPTDEAFMAERPLSQFSNTYQLDLNSEQTLEASIAVFEKDLRGLEISYADFAATLYNEDLAIVRTNLFLDLEYSQYSTDQTVTDRNSVQLAPGRYYLVIHSNSPRYDKVFGIPYNLKVNAQGQVQEIAAPINLTEHANITLDNSSCEFCYSTEIQPGDNYLELNLSEPQYLHMNVAADDFLVLDANSLFANHYVDRQSNHSVIVDGYQPYRSSFEIKMLAPAGQHKINVGGPATQVQFAISSDKVIDAQIKYHEQLNQRTSYTANLGRTSSAAHLNGPGNQVYQITPSRSGFINIENLADDFTWQLHRKAKSPTTGVVTVNPISDTNGLVRYINDDELEHFDFYIVIAANNPDNLTASFDLATSMAVTVSELGQNPVPAPVTGALTANGIIHTMTLAADTTLWARCLSDYCNMYIADENYGDYDSRLFGDLTTFAAGEYQINVYEGSIQLYAVETENFSLSN